MLRQLGDHRVSHALDPINLSLPLSVHHGMPTKDWRPVNGKPEVTGAEAATHLFLKLSSRLWSPIHPCLPLFPRH
jgi:hypothetical protein